MTVPIVAEASVAGQQRAGEQRAGEQGSGRRRSGRELWTEADVGDQAGRTAIVTGANSGIGFEAARVLAEHGARVVLACRSVDAANAAVTRITAAAPAAAVETRQLDLASLASVRQFAEEVRSGYSRIDLLVNNAGVMMPPYGRTEDGFELQFGTNHLGHFALTGLVLDRLLAAGPGSRVVTVSSNGHRMGRIRLDDLQWEHGYRRVSAYGQSKLANLQFSYELQRRLTAAGAATIAVAAHPGTSQTELERHLPGWMRRMSWLTPHQPARFGALPTLRAATDPVAAGADYYGPDGRFQFTGYPVKVRSSARSHDADVQRRLWEVSEKLTGVSYPV
jgi:NAD(P)-dependent dehydrogenase (short-subunit alcohol dehydrogenase family)